MIADNFAAALLMPVSIMSARWAARNSAVDLHDWLNDTAVDMRVSAIACMWRLHNLGVLSKTTGTSRLLRREVMTKLQDSAVVFVDTMIVIEAVGTGCWNAISGQRRSQ